MARSGHFYFGITGNFLEVVLSKLERMRFRPEKPAFQIPYVPCLQDFKKDGNVRIIFADYFKGPGFTIFI